MSLTAAQIQFAAEFIALVVTAATVALLVLRPQQRPFELAEGTPAMSRGAAMVVVTAAAALLTLAAACFLHGSLIIGGRGVEWVGLARAVAGAVLLVSFPYPRRSGAARFGVEAILLRTGFVAWLAAGVVELVSGPVYATDALLVAGSVTVTGALLRIGRRSIAVRVAASSAAALLLVVVVLALALSAVISSSVQHQELSRLAARSIVENSAISDSDPLSTEAQLVEAYLASSFDQPTGNPLAAFAGGDPVQVAAAARQIVGRLDDLRSGTAADAGTLLYTNPSGTASLFAGQPRPISSAGFAAAADLDPPSCVAGRQGLFEIGGVIWLAASSPECTSTGARLGVALAVNFLNDSYLSSRARIDPGVALALVAGGHVLATAGITPGAARTVAAAVQPPPGRSVSKAVGDQFASVSSLTATGNDGRFRLSLVLTDRTNTVLSTRDQLFRTLFLIAFGGTILALGLAIFTGDRITAGLRRLTGAAGGIARGDTTARAGVTGEDEVAALGSAFDSMLDSVSAQSAALQAAAEDEARLRNRLEAVVAGMTDALVAVDSFGLITDFNHAAAELTGVAAPSALGRPASDVIRLRNDEGAPLGRRMFQGGDRSTALMARVVRNDTEIPVAVSSGGLRGPAGELLGTVLVFRDMRREQEVEQMKTEFLSRIGHELRTPLTGILGYADILLRRSVPEERARSWHEEILLSARRLLRIVEMLEFFASEGAGRVVLRPEPVDVRALVNGISSSWSGRLPPNLTLGRRLPRGETQVTADQRWLTLAVDELIDNAVKFSPEGGRILIKVTSGSEAVEISVSDQGMGMTSGHYDDIFGDFVQGDNSDTRRFGGLGLGLAVVRRVVEGHGGTIACRSSPGRGTTFILSLPVWPAEAEQRHRPVRAARTRPAPSPNAPGSAT